MASSTSMGGRQGVVLVPPPSPPNPLVQLQARVKDMENGFRAWLTKQSLPVEAAVVTATSAVQGAFIGGLMGNLTPSLPSPSPEVVGFDPQALASIKQAQAVVGGPLVQARNFAVMTGVNAGISCVMKRVRGVEDVQSSVVAGFGSGAMFSLVSGMGGPNQLANAVTSGVAFAVFQGGFFMLVGTVIASFAHFGTAWWLITSIKYVCEPDKLPIGSPWTCPGYLSSYSASIIWGVAGPLRMFGSLGLYWSMNYFFLIGLLAPVPVWLLSRAFPEKKWIKLINIPIILSGTGALPVAKSSGVLPWFALGITFNVFVYIRHKNWWAKHTYVLSAGLDAGLAFMAILIFFALQSRNINGLSWWGEDLGDHCPLATCPTAPGVVVKGCPVL